MAHWGWRVWPDSALSWSENGRAVYFVVVVGGGVASFIQLLRVCRDNVATSHKVAFAMSLLEKRDIKKKPLRPCSTISPGGGPDRCRRLNHIERRKMKEHK